MDGCWKVGTVNSYLAAHIVSYLMEDFMAKIICFHVRLVDAK